MFWEGKKGGKFHIVHLCDAAALQDLTLLFFQLLLIKMTLKNVPDTFGLPFLIFQFLEKIIKTFKTLFFCCVLFFEAHFCIQNSGVVPNHVHVTTFALLTCLQRKSVRSRRNLKPSSKLFTRKNKTTR